MRRWLLPLLCLALALPALAEFRTQAAWDGGPRVEGPVTLWGNRFDSSQNMNFYYFCTLMLAFNPNLAPTRNHVGTLDGAYLCKVGDIDGNGWNDIVASSSNQSILEWFANTGDGVFDTTPHLIGPYVWAAFDIVDLDEDGDGDIIIGIDQISNDHVSWLENNGSGSFTEHVIENFPNVDIGVARDFDQDGDLDLFFSATQSAAVRWYENDGNQNFTSHVLVASGYYGADNIGMCGGDLNGDDYPDIALASLGYDRIIAWIFDPDYTDPTQAFIAQNVANITNAWVCEMMDMDWDGDLDLVTGAQSGRIDWFENDGAAAFTAHNVATGYSGCMQVFPIDCDYDGDIDILSAASGSNTLDWWENDGDFAFTQRTYASSYGGASGVGSGRLDSTKALMAISTASTADSVDWWNIISGFRPSGTLNSSILENEFENPDWSFFDFTGSEPAGTDIAVSVRGGDTPGDVLTADWIGPYTAYFDLGAAIGDGTRYLQYRVEFSTSDEDYTPYLYYVIAYYTDGDLPVAELDLDAVGGEEGILVSWSLTGEAAGFDLLRAPAGLANDTNRFTLLNASPLPGTPQTRYLDRTADPGERYAYLVRVTSADGGVTNYGPVLATAQDSGLARLTLEQSHPNPARSEAAVEFSLPRTGPTSLELFDLAGRRVMTLASGELSAGRHSVAFNVDNLPNGVYFYQLTADTERLTRRMVIAR